MDSSEHSSVVDLDMMWTDAPDTAMDQHQSTDMAIFPSRQTPAESNDDGSFTPPQEEDRAMKTVTAKMAIYFHGELRRARARALTDGEGYQHILFTVERLGKQLWPDRIGLGQFAHCFQELVEQHHPLEGKGADDYEIAFVQRYEIVRQARNDAMHIGAEARNLTSHCVVLSTVLEDTLMANAGTRKIADYMTRGPVCAYEWQRLALIRQTMLEYSYSCLPYKTKRGWYIVWDHDLCEFLWRDGPPEFPDKLKMTLCDAIESGGVKQHEARTVSPDACVDTLLNDTKCGEPILVLVKHSKEDELLGIANAFDLM